MIDNEILEIDLDKAITTEEKEKLADLIVTLSKMDFKRRLAFLSYALTEHANIMKLTTGQLMIFNSSLFHGFLLNTQDCPAKDKFVDECRQLLLTFKSTNKQGS